MKVCKVCDKSDVEFRKWRCTCRKCESLQALQYQERNKERVQEYQNLYKKQYRKTEACKLSYRKSIEKHKDRYNGYQNAYSKSRRKTDPEYRLSMNLRRRLNKAVRGYFKKRSAVKDLGCSSEQLKKHLESKFQPGMTWENYGTKGWHVDHVKPLATFNLLEEAQLKQACHYTNLQPLWARDNLVKGSRT